MDTTQRFSNRVDNYVKYRPSYPQALVRYLYDTVGFAEDQAIADVGSGTGIFTALLLEQGNTVYAVEPNEPMRSAAEANLRRYPGFRSIAGTAEQTTLPNRSVSHIVSAQAFHWFRPEETRREFARIVMPGGIAAFIWNRRAVDADPFAEGYDRLLRKYAPDYEQVKHLHLSDQDFISFFKDGKFEKAVFANEQRFDWEGLQGRLQSSSYAPLPGDARYEPLTDELRLHFEQQQQDGTIVFRYDTEIYWGIV